jgi:hypothetical protein
MKTCENNFFSLDLVIDMEIIFLKLGKVSSTPYPSPEEFNKLTIIWRAEQEQLIGRITNLPELSGLDGSHSNNST